jgi:hypothetical protein
MADFSVTITVPDDKVADLQNALRARFGTNQDGSAKTPAELKALFDAEVKRVLRRIYSDYIIAQRSDPDLGET